MPSVGTRIRQAMRTTPKRYQIRGVRFLEQRNGRGLIGDDMGVGKTYQAIAWLSINTDLRPVVIVCPATAKFVWKNQFMQHAGTRVEVLEGMTPYKPRRNILILNYDIIASWLPQLLKLNPKVLMLDECQRIKNRTAKRTIACVTLSKKVDHFVALSGTPILSRPVEFFPTLHAIDRQAFSSFWRYAFRYCKPKRGYRGRGWDFSGASHLDELREQITPLMIRRLKSEVLPELPDKLRTILPVRINNRTEYIKARDNFLEWLQSTKGKRAVRKASGAVALVRLTSLLRLVAEGKKALAQEWIRDWLTDTNKKLVVFGIHRDMVEGLHKAFPGSVCITGGTKYKDREKAITRFQCDNKCRLFFGNIRAAGEAITLTAASSVLFVEIGWTPAEHNQAEDRVLRIGQEADVVDIYYMIGKDTIEEKIMDVLDSKRDVVGQILDGKGSTSTIFAAVASSLRREK